MKLGAQIKGYFLCKDGFIVLTLGLLGTYKDAEESHAEEEELQ